jgi:hypothetical protein
MVPTSRKCESRHAMHLRIELLKRAVTIAQAQAEMPSVAGRLEREHWPRRSLIELILGAGHPPPKE